MSINVSSLLNTGPPFSPYLLGELVPINPARFDDLVSGRSRGIRAFFTRLGLRCLTIPYRIGVALRNRSFNRHPERIHRADVPVISVGNITAGGTGKTPMVEWICRHYRTAQHRVAILSRGYGAERDSVNDEALQLEHLLPDVPHLQDRDRSKIADIAVEELESEVLVLDDGFQHRKLHRDLDLVLVDATNPFGYGFLLPRGLLREPVSQLRRASLLVITRTDQVSVESLSNLKTELARYAPQLKLVETVHRPACLRSHSESNETIEPDSSGKPTLSPLRQARRSAAFCGIGNPASFRHTLEQLGLELVAFKAFPDHCRFDRANMQELTAWLKALPAEQKPEQLYCTHKDLVKIRTNTLLGIPLHAVCIELKITHGEQQLVEALDHAIDKR